MQVIQQPNSKEKEDKSQKQSLNKINKLNIDSLFRSFISNETILPTIHWKTARAKIKSNEKLKDGERLPGKKKKP